MRHLRPSDHWVLQADRLLRTLSPQAVSSQRPHPDSSIATTTLSAEEKRHAAGLMRVNHSGEVCAQALYQGQALTARLPAVREQMAQAAREETDHLAWCEHRVHELGYSTSRLNPLWYGLSFVVGAVAGLAGDEISLGFVAETERQVGRHLQEHLAHLPAQDLKSRAIVALMAEDEERHGAQARAAGGVALPPPVTRLMQAMAKVMTRSAYRI